jgi:hypothetical protein
MKVWINYVIKVFAMGLIVLVLFSLSLFWARLLSEASIGNMIPDECRQVTISPSGLVPPEFENEPNIVEHSRVSAGLGPAGIIYCLGIVDYFAARVPHMPGARHATVYYYDQKHNTWSYFDQKTGQIVFFHWMEKVQLYAGPEGIAQSPDKALGRFISPIVDAGATWGPLTLYDKKLHRFFTINFEKRVVTKGPEPGKDDPHKPIQIGLLWKNPFFLHLYWVGPRVRVAEKEAKDEYRSPSKFKEIIERNYSNDAGRYLLVLDETGRIDLLDKETLKFAGTAGYLPAPQTFFPSKEGVTPQDLLAYNVLPLAFNTDDKYRGMFVASVSRDDTAMVLAVFNEKGERIDSKYTEARAYVQDRTVSGPEYVSSSSVAFFNAPWAPVSTIAKYLLENLHPPVLSVVSFFSAYTFEAAAGHRALFILPNSFIAMKGRDISESIVMRFSAALLIILPSIMLGIFLAWRVNKDATVVGLSENARLCWMIGIIAFGLSGYITYRLTRPRETLVTCANCGKLRRPDMNKCHRCGSKWHVPELTPPTWRVLDR